MVEMVVVVVVVVAVAVAVAVAVTVAVTMAVAVTVAVAIAVLVTVTVAEAVFFGVSPSWEKGQRAAVRSGLLECLFIHTLKVEHSRKQGKRKKTMHTAWEKQMTLGRSPGSLFYDDTTHRASQGLWLHELHYPIKTATRRSMQISLEMWVGRGGRGKGEKESGGRGMKTEQGSKGDRCGGEGERGRTRKRGDPDMYISDKGTAQKLSLG